MATSASDAGMPPPGMTIGADGMPQRKSTVPEWLREDVARLASLAPSCEILGHLQVTASYCPGSCIEPHFLQALQSTSMHIWCEIGLVNKHL